MILDEIKNIKSTEKELKKFGITIGVALLAGALLMVNRNYYYPYVAIAGLAFIIFAYSFPLMLKPVQKVWITLAILLGWVSTRVILSLLFYLVITPIGLIARMLGKVFLDKKPDKGKTSYWNYRAKKEYLPSDTERQF